MRMLRIATINTENTKFTWGDKIITAKMCAVKAPLNSMFQDHKQCKCYVL